MTHSARFNQELSWWDQIYYMLTNNGEGLLAVAILPKTPQKKVDRFSYLLLVLYILVRSE
jgi:hypothetical protein